MFGLREDVIYMCEHSLPPASSADWHYQLVFIAMKTYRVTYPVTSLVLEAENEQEAVEKFAREFDPDDPCSQPDVQEITE